MGNSYGFIEVVGVSAAIDALDIMCKTSDVEFVTWERKLGGRLVTIIIRGTVSAVKAAVDSAAENGIKEPVAKAVIANPHEEIEKIIQISASRLA
ncbi:MAG: BMC domain-containing protein [Lachnospiraceae bacterium]